MRILLCQQFDNFGSRNVGGEPSRSYSLHSDGVPVLGVLDTQIRLDPIEALKDVFLLFPKSVWRPALVDEFVRLPGIVRVCLRQGTFERPIELE